MESLLNYPIEQWKDKLSDDQSICCFPLYL